MNAIRKKRVKKNRVKDKYGLIPQDWDELERVFSKYSDLEKVFLFGSRSMGTHRNGSDIDLAIVSGNRKVEKRMHDELEEETKIPYFLDVINLETISSEPLKDHITRNGVLIYER